MTWKAMILMNGAILNAILDDRIDLTRCCTEKGGMPPKPATSICR
jgi:hypothetical protein